MSKASSKKTVSGLKPQVKLIVRKTLPVCVPAKKIHRRIVSLIRQMSVCPAKPPFNSGFLEKYQEMLNLFEQYQREIITHSEYTMTCVPGCNRCCNHWVEDVYSFEAEIIGEYVRRKLPEKIKDINEMFSADLEAIQRLDSLVTDKLIEHGGEEEAGSIDSVDLLLASFYQLRRPCAFLNNQGQCGIYPVRPLTCRIYVSFSDPAFCDPEYINEKDVKTYLLDMEESASGLLDSLHEKYDRFDGDTGLRSVMLKCLAPPS